MYKVWWNEKGEFQYKEYSVSEKVIRRLNESTEMIIEQARIVQQIKRKELSTSLQ